MTTVPVASGVRTAGHQHRRPHFDDFLVLCIAEVFSLDEQAVHLLQRVGLTVLQGQERSMGTLHQKVRAAELLMRAKAWPACQP
jgi:hypothetical protein